MPPAHHRDRNARVTANAASATPMPTCTYGKRRLEGVRREGREGESSDEFAIGDRVRRKHSILGT